jgi:hypothetical protein
MQGSPCSPLLRGGRLRGRTGQSPEHWRPGPASTPPRRFASTARREKEDSRCACCLCGGGGGDDEPASQPASQQLPLSSSLPSAWPPAWPPPPPPSPQLVVVRACVVVIVGAAARRSLRAADAGWRKRGSVCVDAGRGTKILAAALATLAAAARHASNGQGARERFFFSCCACVGSCCASILLGYVPRRTGRDGTNDRIASRRQQQQQVHQEHAVGERRAASLGRLGRSEGDRASSQVVHPILPASCGSDGMPACDGLRQEAPNELADQRIEGTVRGGEQDHAKTTRVAAPVGSGCRRASCPQPLARSSI